MTSTQIQTRQIRLHDVVVSVGTVVARYCWISLIGGLLSGVLVWLRKRDGICLTMMVDGFTIQHGFTGNSLCSIWQ
jgi:hypothetical protein